MAIVCDERDVVGISVHQHEGDLIILEFFWVWELMKKTDGFCYAMNFAIFTSIVFSSSCNKNFDCFESEARNHEEELFYVLELKVVFWLAMLLELWLASDVEFPAAQVIRKKDEELFGALGGLSVKGQVE